MYAIRSYYEGQHILIHIRRPAIYVTTDAETKSRGVSGLTGKLESDRAQFRFLVLVIQPAKVQKRGAVIILIDDMSISELCAVVIELQAD